MKFLFALLPAISALSLLAQLTGPPHVKTAPRTEVNPIDGLTYVWIPAGVFMMGCSPNDSDCSRDEKPAHSVTIGKAFRIGQTLVTQDAYQRVTGKTPGYFKGPEFPVDSVSWDEAQIYCEATGMRLPTEAEWEYAARAGTTASRYGEIERIAWYTANSADRTHDVMRKEPNAWGLYDMLGSLWEWTADWYAAYTGEALTDPRGAASGKIRVVRGGSWGNGPAFVRVSVRSGNEPQNRGNIVGFRCAGD